MTDTTVDAGAEAIRREHIGREATIRSIGILYYLGAAAVILAAILGALGVLMFGKGGATDRGAVVIAIPIAFLGVVQIFAGRGLRTLQQWGQGTAAVLAFLGMFAFPIGTLIGGAFLYLFFSQKGRTVFTPAYRRVVAATPHVKYRTPVWVWLAAAVLGALLVLALVLLAR